MKRIFLVGLIFSILIFPSFSFAQGTSSISNLKNYADATIENALKNVSSSINVNATSGEAITTGDICKIANIRGSQKAYKYLTSLTDKNEDMLSSLGGVTHITVLSLSSDRFIIIYANGDSHIYGIIGTLLPNSSISYSNPTRLVNDASLIGYSSPMESLVAEKIDTNKIALAWQDCSNYLYSKIISVDGTTINNVSGASKKISTTTVYYLSICQLNTDKYVVAFQNDGVSNKLYAVACSVSGYTITEGATTKLSDTAVYPTKTCKLNTDKFVTFYSGGGANGTNYTVGNVSGTTITPGTEGVLTSSFSMYFPMYATAFTLQSVSTDKFIVAYQSATDNNYLYAVICNASGTVVTASTPVKISGSYLGKFPTLSMLDTTHFIAFFKGTENGGLIYNKCTISSNTITSGTPIELNTYSTITFLSAIVLDSVNNRYIPVYDYNGYLEIMSYSPDFKPIITPAISNSTIGSLTTGSFKLLTPGLKLSGLSGLTAFTPYYLNSSSQLSSTVNANYYVGTALSTTDLLIDGSNLNAGANSTTAVCLQRK